MQITVQLPDDLASHPNAGREALEALVLAGFQNGALSSRQARVLLGFETRFDLDAFLKSHGIEAGAYDRNAYLRDLATIAEIDAETRASRQR